MSIHTLLVHPPKKHPWKTSRREVSMLVIGTENRMIYILDSNALNLAAKVKLEAVPTFISVLGLFDVEYRTGTSTLNHIESLRFRPGEGKAFCEWDVKHYE